MKFLPRPDEIMGNAARMIPPVAAVYDRRIIQRLLAAFIERRYRGVARSAVAAKPALQAALEGAGFFAEDFFAQQEGAFLQTGAFGGNSI